MRELFFSNTSNFDWGTKISGSIPFAKGIDPDIFVPQSKLEVLEKNSSRKESDLRGHLKEETNSDNSKEEDKLEKTADSESKDYQLDRALSN